MNFQTTLYDCTKCRKRCWALWAGLMLVSCVSTTQAQIYQWQWVNPSDPSQGVVQSSVVCPDGSGVSAGPSANLGGLDLTQAYLIDA
jgi:hypothetical protein